jgi:hypothetical protein
MSFSFSFLFVDEVVLLEVGYIPFRLDASRMLQEGDRERERRGWAPVR